MPHPFDWDKAFKPILALSALIASLAAAYYFAVFLPQFERERTDRDMKDKQAAQLQQQWEKKEAERKESDTKIDLDLCLLSASTAYAESWDASCKDVKDTAARGYKNCLQTLDQSSCLSIWGSYLERPDKDCSLPSGRADGLNESLKRAKDECYRRHPIK